MDISVIVPIYNVDKYLEKCLNSTIGQTFKGDFEIICVDDGSTDKSGEILDEFAKRCPKIKAIHQNHQGVSGARNTAMEQITGKYTAFVDSDDYIAQQALEELYNYAESHNADLVMFDHLFKPKGSEKVLRQHFKDIAEKYGDNPFNIDTADTFVYYYIPVAIWMKFYRTDLVKDIKFEYGMNNEDIPHWDLVYTKAKNIYYYPNVYYFYNMQREDSISLINGIKIFDIFIAFSLSEKILRERGYFEKFKSIYYAHFTSHLIHRMQRIKPELRREFVESIKKLVIDIDYDEFDKENFHQFEKDAMKIIRFIKAHSFEESDKMMKTNKLWG